MARETEVKARISMKDDTRSGISSAKGGIEDFAKGAMKIVAVAVAMKAVADSVIAVTKDFIELETSTYRLAAAVRVNPLMDAGSARRLNDYANAMQNIIRVDDAVIRNQMAFATNLGLTETQIDKVTRAAADWAATGQVSFDQAFQQLTRTYSGMAGMMGRMIPGMKDFTAEQLKTGAAVEFVAKKFAGMNEAVGNTFEASLKRAELAFGDVKEAAGGVISVLAKPFIDAITGVLNKINEFIASDEGWAILTKAVEGVAAAFQFVYDIGKFLIDKVFKVLESIFKPIVDLFKELFKDVDENSIVLKVFAAILVNIGAVLAIIGKSIGQSIQLLVDFGKVMFNVGRMAVGFFEGLATGKWDNFKAAGADTFKAIETLGKNFIQGFIDQFNIMAGAIQDIANNKMGKDLFKGMETAAARAGAGMSTLRRTMTGQVTVGAAGGTGQVSQEEGIRRAAFEGVQEGIVAGFGGIDWESYADAMAGGEGGELNQQYTNQWGGEGGGGDTSGGVVDYINNVVTAAFAGLDQIIQGFKQGGIVGGIMAIVTQLDALSPILNAVKTGLGMLSDIIAPLVDLLMPFVNISNQLIQLLGPILTPILQILAPILKMLGDVLLWLYNNVIVYFANAIIFVVKIIQDIVAFIWNAIAAAVNFLLGWLGVHLESMAYADWTTGWAEQITGGDVSGTGTEETGGAGAGAQYTQGRTINVTVNIYDPIIADGDSRMRSLALLIRDEIRSAEALGG